MKPYFAKYLPVEDEVVTGDYFVERGDVYGPADASTAANIRKGYPAKKAKLFLCSRDIQVGDKNVYSGIHGVYEDDPGPEIIAEIKTDFQLDFIKGIAEGAQVTPFKVLGPISANARWVKDGNEFDEDEWRIFNSKIEIVMAKDVTKLFGHVSQFDPWCIQVKGPCGHFH